MPSLSFNLTAFILLSLSFSSLLTLFVVVQASSKMLKIAPATVLALAGAFYALTALSHHVQVEVFVI